MSIELWMSKLLIDKNHKLLSLEINKNGQNAICLICGFSALAGGVGFGRMLWFWTITQKHLCCWILPNKSVSPGENCFKFLSIMNNLKHSLLKIDFSHMAEHTSQRGEKVKVYKVTELYLYFWNSIQL